MTRFKKVAWNKVVKTIKNLVTTDLFDKNILVFFSHYEIIKVYPAILIYIFG